MPNFFFKIEIVEIQYHIKTPVKPTCFKFGTAIETNLSNSDCRNAKQ